jgi:hypothetical protein
MPSFVSKDHKELMRRLRSIFSEYEVIGDPDPEVNLGRLAGLSDANLRADIFIRFSKREAVVVEWQSGIHALEHSTDWHNKDDIAGRDDLKRQMCVKIGVCLLELWTLDMSDEVLKELVEQRRAASYLSDNAVQALDSKRETFATDDRGFNSDSTFGVDSESKFKSAGFGSCDSSFAPGAGFKKGAGFGKGKF